LIIKKKNTLKD
jgi:hypothetical protein